MFLILVRREYNKTKSFNHSIVCELNIHSRIFQMLYKSFSKVQRVHNLGQWDKELKLHTSCWRSVNTETEVTHCIINFRDLCDSLADHFTKSEWIKGRLTINLLKNKSNCFVPGKSYAAIPEKEVKFISLGGKKSVSTLAGNRWNQSDSGKKNYVRMESKHEKIAV